MPFFIHATAQTWPRVTAQKIAQYLKSALETQERASLVVPGGRTAASVFPLLAETPLVWNRVTVTLTDERWVACDHPDSNEALARQFFEPTGAAIVGLKTPHQNPSDAIGETERRLTTLNRPFDVVFAGMGEDGHTASLFPQAPISDGWLQSADRPDHLRLSMTPKCLLDSRHIVLAVNGEAKHATFDAALEPGSTAQFPIRHILHQNDVEVTVILA